MKVHQYSILLILNIVTLFTSNTGYAQEKISPNLKLQYFKNTDDQRLLKATLTFTQKRNEKPLPNREVTFYAGSKKEILAKIITNEKGTASIQLSNDYKLPLEKDGTWFFSSDFTGKDSIDAASSEISIKDVHLEMTANLVDSIKTINLKAYTSDNGKNIPVSGEAINIFAARMFNPLPIIDGTFDSNGTLSLEFPSDVPGDKDGNLTIIAKFDDHPTFGNVEKREVSQWGIPSRYQEPNTHRALWTKGAPTWMIVALTIMLIGVWGHYMYAIICLIRIKRSAKKEKNN
ncbi:MAG: Ig-like domain-containing protein [Bacteroidales bacterium]|nr:Ig-like domain-containing protein [Bacteroidales bacterium]